MRISKQSLIVSVAVISAILYCSWPLGIVLNPAVGRHDLASQLEAPHEPYNWLFISLDVASGITLLIVSIWQYRALIHRHAKLSVISYSVFALLVIAAALIPLKCDPTIQQCGSLLHNPLAIFHGTCSIVSVLALFAGTTLTAWHTYRQQVPRKYWKRVVPAVLGGWVVFGLGAVIEMFLNIKNNLLQDFFITICSVSVIVVVMHVEHSRLLPPILPESND